MRLKNSIFSMMAASAMLLLGACSQELDMGSNGDRDNGSDKAGTVRFKLGGSAGEVITRATGDELQTAEEKQVTTLLAVVFKDADSKATTGNSNEENDENDTFLKVIDVLNGSGELTDGEYTFEIGDPGAYHICFVANPGSTLKAAIEGLTEASNVKAFKTLEEVQDPETKPMLMTSTFLGANIGSTSTDLGTVKLERVMSRIDIVNLADGVTITKAVLKNRTEKSILISDGSSLNDDYLGEKEYENIDLAGSSAQDATDNTYAAEIYSYEQYGKSDEGKAPTMELTYKMGGDDTKEYKHTVVFKNGDGDDVNLKRNNLYRIKVSNNGASIRFNLSVADWNEGEEFEVGGDQIADGVKPEIDNKPKDYADAVLGDIMLSDGKLISKDATLTRNEKSKAIGVVAFLYPNQDRVGQSVKDKLGHDATGLVLALKNASSTKFKWAATSKEAIGAAYKQFSEAYANSFDGHTVTRKILDGNKNLENDYTAFGSVQNYQQSHPTPLTTTEWYMPSIGEWVDLLSDAGLGGVDIDQAKNESSDSVNIGDATTALNKALNVVGSNNMEKFASGKYYWSSSEYGGIFAYRVDFSSDKSVIYSYEKTHALLVRCVLAF